MTSLHEIRKMLIDVLSDGKPHTRQELIVCALDKYDMNYYYTDQRTTSAIQSLIRKGVITKLDKGVYQTSQIVHDGPTAVELSTRYERIMPYMDTNTFYRELSRVLIKHGYQTQNGKGNALAVLRENTSLCSVSCYGYVYRYESDPDAPEDYDTIQRISGNVSEYVRCMETAPFIEAEGLDAPYKALCEMNGVVLAGMETEYGCVFTTWDCNEDITSLYHGHYHMENYIAAKEDFAVRSGLLAENRLFSNKQLAGIRDAVKYCAEENQELSYQQCRDLNAIAEQIKQIIPKAENQEQKSGFQMSGIQ